MSERPRVSIITPTFNRHRYLPLIYKCVANQSVANIEWLVLDDSPEPSKFLSTLSDPRVKYDHVPDRMMIGTKRNMLIERAKAEIIAQFDDDDFYGRYYLDRMLKVIEDEAYDIAKLYGAFHYHVLHDIFAYWDYSAIMPKHFNLGAEQPDWIDIDRHAFSKNHLGYGFSYVFKRKVWESGAFPDVDWCEDSPFIMKALERFSLRGIQDESFTCLHIQHSTNTSRTFPQYILPRFLLDHLFPDFSEYILGI